MRPTVAILLSAALLAAAPGATESTLESQFLALPSAVGAEQSARVINERMHFPGTPGDYQLAVYMRDRLNALGLSAHLETFRTIVYTPRTLQLQLLGSPTTTFDLHEQPITSDPDGSRPDAGIPFNAGSGDGDVRAPLVYVSRGLDGDYATLASDGVDVHGKVVLVRYGAEFRGNLAKRAQDHGAAGVIFYSDPQDDGFAKGPAYPNGPYRPAGAVQRGTVSFNDDHLRIPTLPVTSITAKTLLSDMRGKNGPAQWGGALPVNYVVGQTRSLVHLHVVMNATPTTLWNTVGEIPGRDPDQTVILGAHRDAWVYGVSDDGSGIASLLETARGLGALYKNGWRPLRTIRIIGFDAEELGELGSHAYVTAHFSELSNGCVAYINVDEAASGPRFGAEGAAALIPVVSQVAQQVDHVKLRRVRPPGGGSDFEAFIYSAGAPIVGMGYGGPFGVYHSAFDDFDYMSRIADPGFVHHRAIAQTAGLVAMRLADSPAIPYSFESYDDVLEGGVKALAQQAQTAGISLNTDALVAAIHTFESAASSFDSKKDPAKNSQALEAVRILNRVAYSSNGYAAVAFPQITSALAVGRPAADTATAQTAASLDKAAALLR